MFSSLPRLTKPGLFITATDTGVGKTVATCAIAAALRKQGARRVGVCKPFASGCRKEREGLVSEDAEALAHFADCRAMLDVINPIRYAKPLAPAVAAELAGQPPDVEELGRCLSLLDREHDVMLIEGVGGLLVPLSPSKPKVTVLDLIQAIGYPVVIVTRAGLGTLNHTAMTVRLLRDAGCDVAGLVVNGYVPDPGDPMMVNLSAADVKHLRLSATHKKSEDSSSFSPSDTLRADPQDESMMTNRRWLQRMNSADVLATLPLLEPSLVAPQRGVIPEAILDAAALTQWLDVVGESQR